MYFSPKIYILKDNILHNLKVIRNYLGDTKKICLTIKSNAYGHGIVHILGILKDQNVEYFGISSVEEAGIVQSVVKSWKKKPRLLFYTQQIQDDIKLALEKNCELMVGDVAYLKHVQKYAVALKKQVSVHIHLDTGMGRLGFLESNLKECCALLKSNTYINVVGISTHFSQSEDSVIVQQQLERYIRYKQILYQHIHFDHPPIEHAANSGAFIWQKQSYFDMIRPGILLYGSYAGDKNVKEFIGIKPAMKLVAYISRVNRYPAHYGISYGASYRTKKETNIAVINIGYGKGLLKMMGNNSDVLIHNKRYPIVGNVTMDMCMVDMGDDIAYSGDEVIFWGDDNLRIEDQAKAIGVIPYEFICTISSLIKRIVV